MSKLKFNPKKIKKEADKAEFKRKFNDGQLSDSEIAKLEIADLEIYLSNALKIKYKHSYSIKINCTICAKIALEKESGYISDEDIIAYSNGKMKHV